MTMLQAMRLAMLQASEIRCPEQCRNDLELAMHGRTDERTNGDITHLIDKASPSLTCARVQKRIEMAVGK